MDNMHLIGAALSPLFIMLFAAEMSSSEQAYNAGIISGSRMGARTLCCMIKLPFCIMAPMLFRRAWTGIVLMAALAAASVVCYVREQWLLSRLDAGSGTDSAQAKDNGMKDDGDEYV